ncbi:unnamed protein product [Trypanosoma congolense IL3000]|uniref:WGS project CAEQ00000000 data, annotated contig 1167 n=1 Tax=Trypanosoma congolense (strain IL3000) TaxID=1068625 RepID=F9W4B6_TRYCI|nr:unnamed protein product [Trypanosoma congolense IL3000]
MNMAEYFVWWIMVGLFMTWFPVSSESSFYPKAIPTEAGGAICTLSRKLKDVIHWTVGKLSELRKTREVYTSKFLDWQLHFHGSPECELNESIFEECRVVLKEVNEEIGGLPAKAILAGALAARSAGRLDEFITVFVNAQKDSFIDGVNYCLGGGGNPARRRDLLDCFPDEEKLEMGENNLAKIPESMTNEKELDLTAALENVKHSAVETYFSRIHWLDIHADCNLIKGKKEGILDGALNGPLWWGGGILTIGKGFNGEIKSSQFIAGEIANDSKGSNSDNKAFWIKSPHTIPHLKKTLAAFQAFKDAAARITRKFSEIEKIEKRIETCLSNETMEDGHTQSCLKSAVKLNAELQVANALLARYHKEKGPLPSGSALILHQSVVNVWYLFAFLL